MILNHRPRNRDVLATLIEESDARFPREGQLDEILKLVLDHIGPVEDQDEMQRFKARIAQEKPDRAHTVQSQSKADQPASGPRTGIVGKTPLDSITAAETATLSTEHDMDIDQDNEEAALWAIMEKEAKANLEGTKDVEDSPLTKYMRELKLRQSEQ